MDLESFGKKKKKSKKSRGVDLDGDHANEAENKENGRYIIIILRHKNIYKSRNKCGLTIEFTVY